MSREDEARAAVAAFLQRPGRAEKMKSKSAGRGRALLHHLGRVEDGDPEALANLVADARTGDSVAREACEWVAHSYAKEGQELPAPLIEYRTDALMGELPRARPGTHPAANSVRDRIIRRAVRIAVAHELPAYSNGAGTATTAVEIVAGALEEIGVFLSREQVTEIWKASPRRA